MERHFPETWTVLLIRVDLQVRNGPRQLRARPQESRMHQFSAVAQSRPTLCNPMDCSTPGFPVRHQLPEFTQTHVGAAIQPSHPLSSPSPPAFNLSQHQGLFRWVSSSHQVAKVLEFQLQHQSFQRGERQNNNDFSMLLGSSKHLEKYEWFPCLSTEPQIWWLKSPAV